MSKCENMTIGIDHYAKLTNKNAEMYAVLKACKSYFEEMGLHEDSVTYKMICAALAAERGRVMAIPCKLHYLGNLYCPFAHSCRSCKYFKRRKAERGDNEPR